MTLENFENALRANAIYETIYDDTEGRQIVVIRLLEMYSLLKKLIEKEKANG